MAQLVNSTPWNLGASGTVTIPQPAAGNLLLCVSYGFATVACKTGSTPWTKHVASLSTMEVACQDYTATGSGETSVTVTLNGSQPVRGFIYELHGLGSYVSGTAPNSTSLAAHVATLPGVATTGPTLMVSAYAYSTTAHTTAQDRMWGCQPLGWVYENGYWSSKWWGQIALSDVPGAGTYAASSGNLSAASVQAGAWFYADTSGIPTNPAYPNSTVAENSITGTHESQWFGVGANANIAGYCDAVSYLPGSTVGMQVDSASAGFTATIFRLGQYGYCAYGARQVAQVTGTPAAQAAPTVDALGATVCSWTTTASWTIPASAQPGVYLVLWRRTDNTSYVAQGLFVVRPPSGSSAAVAVITADQTWQAYNPWGATSNAGSTWTGKNLYGADNNGNITQRSFAVSCDRPMATQSSDAITSLWDSEISLINLLEACGYDLAYYAMTDLEADPTLLQGHTLAVINGHSEYWSLNQRQAVENALLSGVNLASFSSNTMLWRVRYAAGDSTHRYMICYKDTVAGASIDPGGYTGTWRDPGSYNPDLWHEEAQVGQQFLASANNSGNHVFSATYAGLPCYRNTANIAGLTGAGTYTVTLTTTIGEELDYVAASSPATPANLVSLNAQSYNAVNVTNAAGYPYTGSGTYTLGPSLYMRSNGALVFTTGSWRFAAAASPYRLSTFAGGGSVDTNIQQAIVNVLADLGAQPGSLLDAPRNGTASGLVQPGAARNPAAYGLGVYVPAQATQRGGFF